MADGTGIEWTQATWNPTTGCDKISDGCDHCYALSQAKRLKAMGSKRYQTDGNAVTSGPGFGLTMHDDNVFYQPLRWTRGRKIFVNSMSDLFHGQVTVEYIGRVWAVMAATPQHQYQILTKRAKRMRTILTNENWTKIVTDALTDLKNEKVLSEKIWKETYAKISTGEPLENVWLGTSVEHEKTVHRISELISTPAAIRFLSCEPLIGALDLKPYLTENQIHWVIVGGESGVNARAMDPVWALTIRDDCVAANVAFLFKQWGEWGTIKTAKKETHTFENATMYKIGKHKSGRTLDGKIWDDYPKSNTVHVRGNV